MIEEQTRGDTAKAELVRAEMVAVTGDSLAAVRPGSSEALQLKEMLIVGAGAELPQAADFH